MRIYRKKTERNCIKYFINRDLIRRSDKIRNVAVNTKLIDIIISGIAGPVINAMGSNKTR